MIDIDHFKLVNDTYGHLIGDAVLTGLAKMALRLIRKEDLLARYGGEEFAVLCRATQASVCFSVAERLRTSLEKTTLVSDLPELQVTLSAGVAAIPNADVDSAEALVDAADKALYHAKRSGRNRVCLYDPDMAGPQGPL